MSDAPSRGRIPNDLRRRLDQVCGDAGELLVANRVAHYLQGRTPAWYRGARLRQLKDGVDGGVWDLPELERALDLLIQVGYGESRTRPRADRAHGTRLQHRMDGVLGQLPRALALRYPTTDDRHATGPLSGLDRYGPVEVNHTPRDGHLGLIAAALGLWRKRAASGERYVDVTRGELAYLLRAGRRESQRGGGGDTEWVSRLLGELHAEEITAAMDDRRRRSRDQGREHSAQHRIPESAIIRIEARWDGEWLSLTDYQQRRREDGHGPGSGQRDTVRIHLAPWALQAVTEERAVFVNFAIWRGLSGTGRRLYAFLQGSTVEGGRIAFYLAPAMRFTLGLRGARVDKIATIVRHQLRELYHRDQRYHHQRTSTPSGFRQLTRHEDGLPLFHMYVQAGKQSLPRAGFRTEGPTPRRPTCLRGDAARRITRVSPYDVAPQDIPGDLAQQRGFEQARAYVARIRQSVTAAQPPRREWATPPEDHAP